MIIIVDGYNVLKNIDRDATIDKHKRALFVQHLYKYARLKGHNIILVFDASPSLYSSKEQHNCITVIYSGTKQTADEYIMDYINSQSSDIILVVSSDRKIAGYAAQKNIVTLEALLFYSLMQSAIDKGKPQRITQRIRKLTTEENPELDALMEEAIQNSASKHKDKEIEETSKILGTGAKKRSKEERRLESILKKL